MARPTHLHGLRQRMTPSDQTQAAAATPLVIGITGHRNLCPDEVGLLTQRVRELLRQLQQEFPHLPLCVLSSLAAGADQLVAQAALDAGAELIAPLPFARTLYADDFAGASRTGFDALCARAQVLELPLLPGLTTGDIDHYGEARNRQYAQAGVFVASHCHILIALWDGRPSPSLGGTAQIVRFHLEGIAPGHSEPRHAEQAILESADESLLYHIACSRCGADGTARPPAEPLQPGAVRWLSEARVHDPGTGIPPEFRRMFVRQQQYNDDLTRWAAGNADHAGAPRNETLESLLASADTLALHFQRRVLLAMRGLYALGALMGLAFIVYSDLPAVLPGQHWSIVAFVALFATGVGLAWLAHRREWHRKYIDYRALAEGLRVQGYWRRAGIGAEDPGGFAHDNFMQKQDVELGWIRNVMRAAGVRGMDDPIEPGALDVVIREWVGDPAGAGQLGYFARKITQLERAHRHTRVFTSTLLAGMAVLAIVLALTNPWLGTDTAGYLVSLMAVLAIVAATREAYAFRKADQELLKQYRYMRSIFATARRKLDADPGAAAHRGVLRALGEVALAEHAQWALLYRERPPEAGKM